MRFFAASVCLAIGCTPPRDAQPPVPVAASEATPTPTPTPKELCDHASALAKKKGKEKELSGCPSKAEKLRADHPDTYACLAKCVTKSSDLDDIDGCEKNCPKPVDRDDEAYRTLGSIETGAKHQFQQETDTSNNGMGPYAHRHCPSSKAPVPATLQAADAAHVTTESEWAAPTWKCLRLELSGPLFFQYSYEWNGKDGAESAYVATARRRLPNGKTRVVTLKAKGTIAGDTERISIASADES